MYQFNERPLFIFEMANNHMGDVDHGLRIVNEFSKVVGKFNFDIGFKLQYRDLKSFIHPNYRERKDIKYVKRFSETVLTKDQYKRIKDEIIRLKFISICTAFDEVSVDLIEEHGYDIIKVGSCSFTDWPLLERIVAVSKPIILSTAGATIDEIDNVVNFFEHRDKHFALLHCVGEYPTQKQNLQLNQLDFFKNRFPKLPIGYSTHELPTNMDSIKVAAGKGAMVFERHVGIRTDKYSLNDYSSTPDEVVKWLESAQDVYDMCGVKNQRRTISAKEEADLDGLKRGVFVLKSIVKGEKIDRSKIFLAIPNCENQILANNLSKYSQFISEKDMNPLEPILFSDVKLVDLREVITNIANRVKKLLHEAKISLPEKIEVELSHHYGIAKFY
jgi:sialic acid synthase SpsE